MCIKFSARKGQKQMYQRNQSPACSPRLLMIRYRGEMSSFEIVVYESQGNKKVGNRQNVLRCLQQQGPKSDNSNRACHSDEEWQPCHVQSHLKEFLQTSPTLVLTTFLAAGIDRYNLKNREKDRPSSRYLQSNDSSRVTSE